MSRRRQVRPLDWILWSFLIFSKGHPVFSGQVHQDQTHHGWSTNFGPNVMVFDDIPNSPNVKELSSFNISPMRSQQRPEEVEESEDEHFVLKFQDLPPWRPRKAASSSESSSVVGEFRKRERQKEPVRLDLRPYNPLMSHIILNPLFIRLQMVLRKPIEIILLWFKVKPVCLKFISKLLWN